MTEHDQIKSPYFRNTIQADPFVDKVSSFDNLPNAIAIGFEGDPNQEDCAFQIATKKTETEGEMLSALVYTIVKIAQQKGLIAKVTFAPDPAVEKKIIALAEQVIANVTPITIFRKPPEEPTNV